MYFYKIKVLAFFGIKSPLEKRIEQNLVNLENVGMLDLMSHQFSRYKVVTHFTLDKTVHESWIRR